jgi:solute carrier family 66 (lysosomal lysine-arginine transporter), member 1
VIVYAPQFIENYRHKSGEAISVIFIVIWLLGDICNLIGACLAHLLSTVIILAFYVRETLIVYFIGTLTVNYQYALTDILLLLQIYYYRWSYDQHQEVEVDCTEATEESSLLGGGTEFKIYERRSTNYLLRLAKCLAALSFLITIIVVTWWISARFPDEDGSTYPESLRLKWAIQTLGWSSATLYRTCLNFDLRHGLTYSLSRSKVSADL